MNLLKDRFMEALRINLYARASPERLTISVVNHLLVTLEPSSGNSDLYYLRLSKWNFIRAMFDSFTRKPNYFLFRMHTHIYNSPFSYYSKYTWYRAKRCDVDNRLKFYF